MTYDELKAENAELHADYEALADEHTKLRDQLARVKAEVDEARKHSGAGMKVMLGLSDELVAENARLKAEVERLQSFCTRTIIPNETLQAEVERLRKAGDTMALEYLTLCRDTYCDGWLRPFKALNEFKVKQVEDWNAAKEGKPSV